MSLKTTPFRIYIHELLYSLECLGINKQRVLVGPAADLEMLELFAQKPESETGDTSLNMICNLLKYVL